MKEETNTAEAEVSPNETTAAAAVPVIGDNTPAETSAPAVSEISLAAETAAPVDEAEPVSASEEAYTEQETSLSEAETEIATTETETTVSESEQETTVSEAEQETTVPETEAVTTVPESVQEIAVTTVPETEITTVPSVAAPQYVPSPSTGTTPSAAETTTTVTTEETSTETTEPLPTGYTINFETSEEGVTMPESITAEEGETVALPAVPEKTGYTGHWEIDGETVTSVTVDRDITVTAVYAINSYTITYDTNMDGLNLSPAVSYFQYGKNLKASLPDLPEVEGYTGEWQIDGKAIPDDYTVSEDITVTAFYTINTYTITFETSETDVAMPESVTKDYGTEYTLPDVPEKTGHDGHWEIDGEEVTSVTVDGDITVTAVYTVQKYPVIFEYALDDEAIISEDRVTGEFDTDFEFEYSSLISYHVNANTAKPDISGYEFDHWLYNGETFSDTDTVKVPDENGIILTAVYKRTGYVITYHYLKDSTDIKTQVIPIGEPMQIEYSSGTGTWIYEDDQGEYHEQYDGHSVSSDLDIYEGITISIDEVSWSNNGSTGKDEFVRYYSGSELIKKYGDTITETELDMLQNVYNSKYYVVNDRISDISPYSNTDTVFTAQDLKSVEATKSIYIVPVLRFNYNGTVYNYFGALRNSNKNYDAFLDSLGTPEDGEEWCIEPNGSTVMQQSFFKYGSEFSVFAGEIGYNNEPLTLSIKKPATVTFKTKNAFYEDETPSTTETINMGDGETFGSSLPAVTNGTTWVYIDEESQSYKQFTADTPVQDGMEIYNGVSVTIMVGADKDYIEKETVYARSYTYAQSENYFKIPEDIVHYAEQKLTPENNSDISVDQFNNIEYTNIILYEVTDIIALKDKDSSLKKYYMNSGYDSNVNSWLPEPSAGYKWQEADDAASWDADRLFEEVPDGTGISLDFSLPITAIPDSEDDPEAKINTDAAEPAKPEDIPEPTETPDGTGNGE